MTTPLFTTAPGFDAPLAVLRHCHERIRKQLATLQKLLVHLPAAGADLEARQAATAVLRYFHEAAHNHHDDEEQDLLPMLERSASGEDAELLAGLLPDLLADHQRMDALWQGLAPSLQQVAAGDGAALPAEIVQAFCDAYNRHMEIEETRITPMAQRLFSAAQLDALGAAMRRRRGLPD